MARERAPHTRPELCRLPVVIVLVMAIEMLVLVLSLAPGSQLGFGGFAVASLYAQWLGLSSMALLCALQTWLQRRPAPLAWGLAWALPVTFAALGSLLVHMVFTDLLAAPRGEFVLGSVAITAFFAAAGLRYAFVQSQWQAQIRASADARVQALQARIRPHFLFNSMNSIASLVRRDPASAERAIEDLSDLFRAALGVDRPEGTLGEEIELARRYLAIESLRLGPRLCVDWDIAADVPRDMPMPRLVLQPLVENAIVHGIARLEHGGTVRIAMRREARRVHIEVGNPTAPLHAPDPDPGEGHAHALNSIALRLSHRFGAGTRVATRRDGDYHRCELSLEVPGPEPTP